MKDIHKSAHRVGVLETMTLLLFQLSADPLGLSQSLPQQWFEMHFQALLDFENRCSWSSIESVWIHPSHFNFESLQKLAAQNHCCELVLPGLWCCLSSISPLQGLNSCWNADLRSLFCFFFVFFFKQRNAVHGPISRLPRHCGWEKQNLIWEVEHPCWSPPTAVPGNPEMPAGTAWNA